MHILEASYDKMGGCLTNVCYNGRLGEENTG